MNVWQHVQLMLKVDDSICIIMIEVYLGLLCFILAIVVTVHRCSILMKQLRYSGREHMVLIKWACMAFIMK
jgi:hypothetical protein